MELPQLDKTRDLEEAICYAINEGDIGSASSMTKYLDDCTYNDMMPIKSPEAFTGTTAMDRLEAHHDIENVRKELQERYLWVLKDAIWNREERLEKLDTKLLATKAYDTIALAIVDVRRLVNNIKVTL